jgi:hypothetical protein
MSLFGRRRQAASGVGQTGSGSDLSVEAPCAPTAVATSWLTVPTLAESNGQRRVAGTSFHQQLLARTASQLRAASPVCGVVAVQLAVVENGDYAGSVGVYLAGHRAGTIPADQVDAYRPVVEALTEQGRPATCRAALVGGGGMRDGEGVLNFGLGLLQPNRPEVAGPGASFLPPHVGMRMSIEARTATELDAALPSRAKRFVHRRTGTLSLDGALEIDGSVIGQLEEPPGVRELLRAAHAAGRPLTCAVRLIREPQRPLRVAVDLPMTGAF